MSLVTFEYIDFGDTTVLGSGIHVCTGSASARAGRPSCANTSVNIQVEVGLYGNNMPALSVNKLSRTPLRLRLILIVCP